MAPPPDAPILVVYLDRYHLGDPLFLQRFAPVVKAHAGPLLLVHGSGEAAERALEAEGLPATRRDGVLRAGGERERAIVERAARDLNREVVHALNEAGTPALRLAGPDRGLLRRASDGALAAGKVDWLRALVGQGAVPVLAALVADEAGRVVEAAPGEAVAVLARALHGPEEAPCAVFFATGRAVAGALGAADVEAALPEPGVARVVAGRGVRVRVTHPSALRGAGVPVGVDWP